MRFRPYCLVSLLSIVAAPAVGAERAPSACSPEGIQRGILLLNRESGAANFVHASLLVDCPLDRLPISEGCRKELLYEVERIRSPLRLSLRRPVLGDCYPARTPCGAGETQVPTDSKKPPCVPEQPAPPAASAAVPAASESPQRCDRAFVRSALTWDDPSHGRPLFIPQEAFEVCPLSALLTNPADLRRLRSALRMGRSIKLPAAQLFEAAVTFEQVIQKNQSVLLVRLWKKQVGWNVADGEVVTRLEWVVLDRVRAPAAGKWPHNAFSLIRGGEISEGGRVVRTPSPLKDFQLEIDDHFLIAGKNFPLDSGRIDGFLLPVRNGLLEAPPGSLLAEDRPRQLAEVLDRVFHPDPARRAVGTLWEKADRSVARFVPAKLLEREDWQRLPLGAEGRENLRVWVEDVPQRRDVTFSGRPPECTYEPSPPPAGSDPDRTSLPGLLNRFPLGVLGEVVATTVGWDLSSKRVVRRVDVVPLEFLRDTTGAGRAGGTLSFLEVGGDMTLRGARICTRPAPGFHRYQVGEELLLLGTPALTEPRLITGQLVFPVDGEEVRSQPYSLLAPTAMPGRL